ncbi:hypothetical protein LWI28_025547 [Acer negundo]|uniref:Uncharacterized protein n=1 Tax=Acer negundo TaxID=4023 RepID=A0AAD5IRE2_ACENE|nr:hypothetical protein LWI28_025547 [Acer negundo]KAK4845034.1 hypothetical protein QYF36_027484 [Acer negundo]
MEKRSQSLVWDCGSSLYDSFELNSFKRQLDSAMVSRTQSMPHLSDNHHRSAPLPPQLPLPLPPSVPKKSSSSSKISRSIQRLLKSVFKSKQSSSSMLKLKDRSNWILYDKTGALTTIPEVPEMDFGGLSPEINSLVRRTASERISAASLAISCV